MEAKAILKLEAGAIFVSFVHRRRGNKLWKAGSIIESDIRLEQGTE